MKRILSLLVRLYPREWRNRYGAEMEALIEDSDPRVGDGFDLLRASLAERRRASFERGDLPMIRATHPVRFALIGLAVTAPTAFFVGLAILKYVVGVPGPFDLVEPTVTPFVTHPVGETLVTLAPYVALLLAVIPVLRPRLRWEARRVVGRIELSIPAANVAVALLSLVLIAVMAIYWVAENL